MPIQVPGIDQNTCAAWTPQNVNLYNNQGYYFVKADIKERGTWATWPKLLKSWNWEPGKGNTARAVMVEPSPVLRQFAQPNPITAEPKIDIVQVRERTDDSVIGWQQFATPHFNFLPSFTDFMRGNIGPAQKNISKQMIVFEEMFYRAHMLGYAPYVFVAGHGMIECDGGPLYLTRTGDYDNFTAQGKKNVGWWQNILSKVTEPLSYKVMREVADTAIDEIGCTAFSGMGNGPEQVLDEKWLIVTNHVTKLQLVDDPWVTENRVEGLDLVNKVYNPTPFGNIMLRAEKYGIRMKVDREYVPSMYVPETFDDDTASLEYNRTRPHPEYAKNSQVAISWFVGDMGYEKINVGPPPEKFAGNSLPPGFGDMKWNGEIYSTKNFLTYCIDDTGAKVPQANSFGHWLRLQAEATYGIRSLNKFNCIPIVHLLRKGQLRTSMAPVMGNQPVSQVIVNP